MNGLTYFNIKLHFPSTKEFTGFHESLRKRVDLEVDLEALLVLKGTYLKMSFLINSPPYGYNVIPDIQRFSQSTHILEIT